MTTIREDDVQETRDLLLGHRIVSAEIGSFTVPNTESWNDTASGRIVLDDGTVIYVIPNEGGCVCGAGDYALEHLATVDNVITDVRVATEDGEYGALSYRIYVVADAVEINAVQIDGDDGNGYYGHRLLADDRSWWPSVTATEPASLDALLANATPVETEPFDLGALLDGLMLGLATPEAEAIARHVNTERVRTENARRWVDRLQGECADKDRRITEALRWLEMAESYSLSEDCSAAIDDAMAALRGEES